MSAHLLHRLGKTHALGAPEPARRSDLPAIEALFAELFPADPTAPDPAELHALTGRDNAYLSVVRAGGNVAGFVLLRDQVWRPWTNLAFLGVAAGLRGCGVAGALTRHAMATARRPVLRLVVREANHVARHVYSGHGMKVCGRRASAGGDALVMMRWLGGQRRAAGLKPATASLR